MRHHHKHLHIVRRKMSHVIDELYTALLHAGGDQVDLRIHKEEDGLRLVAEGDFLPEHRHEMERMAEILQPAMRNPALVEEFWELAGGDQYTSDSELALVGQMVDEAAVTMGENHIAMELYIRF